METCEEEGCFSHYVCVAVIDTGILMGTESMSKRVFGEMHIIFQIGRQIDCVEQAPSFGDRKTMTIQTPAENI